MRSWGLRCWLGGNLGTHSRKDRVVVVGDKPWLGVERLREGAGERGAGKESLG